MIRLENLTKSIKNELIFSNLNYVFDENTIYLIEGENGKGKSTLLKIIANLIKPTSGKTIWESPHQKSKCGFVFDSPLFIENLSFSDNFRYLGYIHNSDIEYINQKIDYFSEVFRLPIDTKKTVFDYSSGMKRKVELAMSLFHDPNCLIWDEPFNFLDKDAMNVILQEFQAKDKMFIITSPNSDSLIPYHLDFKQVFLF